MNIVILTKAPFPDGNAASTYILNVCRTIAASGHHVTVFGCRRGLKTTYPLSGTIEGIDYINFVTERHNKAVVYLFDNYWDIYAKHKLAFLMNRNYEIQDSLSYSGDYNKHLIDVSLNHGAMAAKLAGAGGGGTIIILTFTPTKIKETLKKAGAEEFIELDPNNSGVTIEYIKDSTLQMI